MSNRGLVHFPIFLATFATKFHLITLKIANSFLINLDVYTDYFFPFSILSANKNPNAKQLHYVVKQVHIFKLWASGGHPDRPIHNFTARR